MPNFTRKAAGLTIVAATLTALLVAREYRRHDAAAQDNYTQFVKKHDIVDATRNAIGALQQATLNAQDYALTGETIYSEGYKRSVREWQDESGSATLIGSKDPAASNAKEMADAGTRAVKELDQIVEAYDSGAHDKALELIRKGAGFVFLGQAREAATQVVELDSPTNVQRNGLNRILLALKRPTEGAAVLYALALFAAILALRGHKAS